MSETLTEQVTIQLQSWIESISDASVKGELSGFLGRLNAPLQVAVVGVYSSGKSSLLNALLGDEILPTGLLPTTKYIYRLLYGDSPYACVHRKDGTTAELPLSDLKSIGVHNWDDDGSHTTDEIAEIRVEYPARILRGVQFIDTPGLNAPGASDTAIAEKTLSKSDVLVWTESAEQVLSGTSVAVLDSYIHRYKKAAMCVICQIDRLNDVNNDVKRLRERVNEHLPKGFSRILGVCAKQALARAPEGNQLPLFHKWFEEEILSRQQDIIAERVDTDARYYLNQQVVTSARDGNTELLRKLFYLEFDPDGADGDGQPLFAAIDASRHSAVELLLDHGASVDVVDDSGKTPLMKAAELGDYQIVNRLLE